MGTWGLFPSDNDGSWDLVGYMNNRHIDAGLKELFAKKIPKQRSYMMWERTGLVVLLLKRGFFIHPKIIITCIEYLDILLSDKDWCANWRNPKSAKIVTQFVRNEFKRLVSKEHERYARFGLNKRKCSRLKYSPHISVGDDWLETPNLPMRVQKAITADDTPLPVARKIYKRKVKVLAIKKSSGVKLDSTGSVL